MRKDPTEFRKRFAKWKAGAKPYQYGVPYEDDSHNTDYDQARANQLNYSADETGHYPTRDYETGRYLKSPTHPTVTLGTYTDMGLGYDVWYNKLDKSLYSQPNFTSTYKDKLPRFEDGKEKFKLKKTPEFVQAGRDNSWSKVTNDNMGEVFQSVVARPNRTGGNTSAGNWKKLWEPKQEKGLEMVSPEFELLIGARAMMPGINGLDRKTYHVARQMKSPALSDEIVDDYAKSWFNNETTFRAPFRSKGRGGDKVGDFIDYNYATYGGRDAYLSQLSEDQRYRLAKLLLNDERFPKTSTVVHMDDTGLLPVNGRGFVPKDATNSKSPWNNSIEGDAEIWWNRGTPYYNAKGYRHMLDIPRTIVSDIETLSNHGITLQGRDVLHGPGVVPFNAVHFGLQPNLFGWFDKIKFVGQ